MNDIVRSSSYFKFILYADDTSLFSLPAVLDTSVNVNIELAKVSKWLSENRLSLNVDKTKSMMFRNINKHVVFPQLEINGSKIEFVDKFKFLGFIVDEHLSWKHHIDHIHKKVMSAVGILYRMKHFLPVSVKLMIYNALVHSYLNSGIILWGHKSSAERSKLVIAQKKCVRSILCLGFNAHTSVHFKSLRILKLKDMLTVARVRFYCKHKSGDLPFYLQSLSFSLNSDVHSYNTIHRNDIHSVHGHQDCLRKVIPPIIKDLPNAVKRIVDLITPEVKFALSRISTLMKTHFFSTY